MQPTNQAVGSLSHRRRLPFTDARGRSDLHNLRLTEGGCMTEGSWTTQVCSLLYCKRDTGARLAGGPVTVVGAPQSNQKTILST